MVPDHRQWMNMSSMNLDTERINLCKLFDVINFDDVAFVHFHNTKLVIFRMTEEGNVIPINLPILF